jgi:hypothetical protein
MVAGPGRGLFGSELRRSSAEARTYLAPLSGKDS